MSTNPRKTVKIETVKEIGNRMLRCSAPEMKEARNAIAEFLEDVLMAADAYRGFMYLEHSRSAVTGEATFGDMTRRHYY